MHRLQWNGTITDNLWQSKIGVWFGNSLCYGKIHRLEKFINFSICISKALLYICATIINLFTSSMQLFQYSCRNFIVSFYLVVFLCPSGSYLKQKDFGAVLK